MKRYLAPLVSAAVLAWTPAAAQSNADGGCSRGELHGAAPLPERPGIALPGGASVLPGHALGAACAQLLRSVPLVQPVRMKTLTERELVQRLQAQLKCGRLKGARPVPNGNNLLVVAWEMPIDGHMTVVRLTVDAQTGQIIRGHPTGKKC